MLYYKVYRHWTEIIVPHLSDRELDDILVRDFNKFTFGCWGVPFTHGQYPRDFETCGWDWLHNGMNPHKRPPCDGERTLFDMNYLALGLPPRECFVRANKQELPVGQYR